VVGSGLISIKELINAELSDLLVGYSDLGPPKYEAFVK
jgi:hypothetical protein